MGFSSLPIFSFFVFVIIIIPISHSLPFIVLHGIGDKCSNKGMKKFTKYLSDNSGAKGYCIEIGNGGWDSWFMTLEAQSQIVCNKVKKMKDLKEGFNFVGLSQGNLIGRAVVEFCDGAPPVQNFISLGGPHAGISSVPLCGSGIWCLLADDLLNYGLHMAVTWWDEEGKVAKEMEELVANHGVQSFKCFMAYKGVFMINDAQMFEVFKVCRRIGALAQVHAENGDAIVEGQARLLANGVTGPEGHCLSRPPEVEGEATYRAIMIADRVNTPVYIVHVMSKEACDAVIRGRAEGKICFGEPIAAGLGTDGCNCWHHNWRHASAFVMGPPLRPDPTVKEYLMKALGTGDLQVVGTDNCTFNSDQKAMGKDDFTKIPNGVNGIEDRLSIVWDRGVKAGILSPSQFVAVTSTNAARLFGMYPNKGVIRVGSDADICVWDPKAERTISAKTHFHAVDFNIFEGMTVQGRAVTTIARGNVVFENGQVVGANGNGKFVSRANFGYPFRRVAARDEQRAREEQPVARDPYTGPVFKPGA